MACFYLIIKYSIVDNKKRLGAIVDQGVIPRSKMEKNFPKIFLK